MATGCVGADRVRDGGGGVDVEVDLEVVVVVDFEVGVACSELATRRA